MINTHNKYVSNSANKALDELISYIRNQIMSREYIARVNNADMANLIDSDTEINVFFGFSDEPEQDRLPAIYLIPTSIVRQSMDISDGLEVYTHESLVDSQINNFFESHSIVLMIAGVITIKARTWYEHWTIANYLFNSIIAQTIDIANVSPHISNISVQSLHLAQNKSNDVFMGQIGFTMLTLEHEVREDEISDIARTTMTKSNVEPDP